MYTEQTKELSFTSLDPNYIKNKSNKIKNKIHFQVSNYMAKSSN